MRIKKLAGYILYNAFAKHLPESYSHIKIFQRQARAFCGKLMLDECGKNVNIERKAVFSTRVRLGTIRE